MPGLSLLKNYRDTLWYLAGSAFLLNSLLPPIFKYVGLRWNSALTVPMVGGYLLFSILGYLFATEDFSRRKRIIIYAFGIFGAVLRYGMTVFLSVRDGAINETFFSYTEYYSVFLAVAVFVFFKNSNFLKKFELNQRIVSIISGISSCSFGVYLMHMFIIRYLLKVIPESYLGIEWQIFGPFVVYTIAVLLTFIFKKLPVLKHIVP
jgi:surface polysaccharide O-acyltransferase-like enzyme